MNLVELDERQGGNEGTIERLSTRTLSFHGDFDMKNEGSNDTRCHTTVGIGPSLGATNGTDSHRIYITKSVEMASDKL